VVGVWLSGAVLREMCGSQKLSIWRSGSGCWLCLHIYKIFAGCSVSFIVMNMEDKIADDARITPPTPEVMPQRPPAGPSDAVAARLVMGGLLRGLGCEILVMRGDGGILSDDRVVRVK